MRTDRVRIVPLIGFSEDLIFPLLVEHRWWIKRRIGQDGDQPREYIYGTEDEQTNIHFIMDHKITADDWAKAEALATDYLKKEQRATDPIEVHRYDEAPFLFAARWSDGHGYVLVFDGKVQTSRGMVLLPAYFAFLGEARLRTMRVSLLGGLLEIFDGRPKGVGPLWNSGMTDQDLFPAIVDSDGVLKYVVHYQETAPKGPVSGARPPGWRFFLYRWSLQLFPVVPELVWKFEEQIERPAPSPPPSVLP